jgi:hypothetical protein
VGEGEKNDVNNLRTGSSNYYPERIGHNDIYFNENKNKNDSDEI